MEEEEREVVRVRVRCEGVQQPESRSFAVDPQITSLDVLQHILIRAFDLSGKSFGISYLGRDKQGHEMYLSLVSEWDLGNAFSTASKPYLQLKIDIKPSEDSPLLEDWDIISPKDVIGTDLFLGDKRALASALPFTQSILSQVGRTLTRVQQALSWTYSEDVKPFKPPLNDAEFHTYLNHEGQLTRPEELRLRIYHGGVEPSLRKVVWRYLLNVYPDGLSGQERMDYMKCKTREYYQLKGEWLQRCSAEDLELIQGNVMKDVLRTDRTHPYYAGFEDNPHLHALHDLLSTYAVTHPQVSYCQGMSDIASPILAVMDNEAHAFICFCGIMKRLEGNFRMDGECMSIKFSHLKLLLHYSDPHFHSYLLSRGADDLLFCYRWLLLELKREFAFEDALRMLEVMWSSLPPDPPEKEVELVGPPCLPGERRKNSRTRHMMRPDRGLSAEGEEEEAGGGEGGELEGEEGEELEGEEDGEEGEEGGELEEGGGAEEEGGIEGEEGVGGGGEAGEIEGEDGNLKAEAVVQKEKKAEASREESCALLKQGSFGEFKCYEDSGEEDCVEHADAIPYGQVRQPTEEDEDDESVWEEEPLIKPPDSLGVTTSISAPSLSSCTQTSQSSPSFAAEENITPSSDTEGKENQELEADAPAIASPSPISLPPPQEFGRGNPFMLFLCLSILLEHREQIMKQNMGYDELAMHFNRLVRRHNLNRVLHRAKTLFADYLQSKVWDSEEGDEAAAESPSTS
ncbi:TBC1 domain family member 25 isoform X2 [Xenopus laevis]|uniref:TBC1 domain family member 25 isoform X2 n=1 Tax=Xenopus laevis TaxID=8355 RepID=A0A8J0THC9_XENLA|nr:TBC1 domain family member 25 isoform X2 [Xenopus laevis]